MDEGMCIQCVLHACVRQMSSRWVHWIVNLRKRKENLRIQIGLRLFSTWAPAALEQLGRLVDACMDGLLDECMGGSMDGWMSGWMDGRLVGWMGTCGCKVGSGRVWPVSKLPGMRGAGCFLTSWSRRPCAQPALDDFSLQRHSSRLLSVVCTNATFSSCWIIPALLSKPSLCLANEELQVVIRQGET